MEAVLDAAVPVFRERGYDGGSIGDLKAATGLTAGSIYKAFKDKSGLFAAAFAHYLDMRRRQLAPRMLRSATGRERIAETIRFYLESASGAEGRQGCLVVASLIEASTLEDGLQDALARAVAENRTGLVAMLRDGQRDGSIRPDLAIEPGADLLLALLHGVRVTGKLHDPGGHEALVTLALKILD